MIKKLLRSVRQYKWISILTPVLMIGEVVCEMLIPYHMADLIDLGIEAGNMEVITSIGIKLLLITLCSMACGAAAAITGPYAATGFASNLRHDMYERIQKFSFSNIDHISASGLVTRITTDVTNVQMAYGMALRMAFRAPCTLIFASYMVFKTSRDLSWILLAAFPILIIAMIVIMGRAMGWFKKVFDIYDKLNNVVQENVRGIRVVKAFVREEDEKKKFGKVSDELYTTNIKAETIMAFVSPIMMSVMYGALLLVSWLGAKMIVSSTLTTGLLMSFINYIMQALSSFMMLGALIAMMTMALAAAKRVVQVLDEEPEIVNCSDPVFEVPDGSISFENVCFAYGKGANCLSDVNLQIKAGETIGIIGGTGSGKSSLVQLIPRLYDATGGTVRVGGIDVKKYDLDTLRKSVSMVLQKNVLFSGSVAENIRWGKEDATDEEIWQALEWAQAKTVVEGFDGGLDYWIEQGGSNVSGGQRQRLCIARALISKPKILILDDSTSAVDTHTESMIRKSFAEDLPEITKLIIAQRISSVQNADRIIVIDDGKISGIGTHDELLASNRIYQEVYESQTKGGDFDEPK